MLYRVTQNKAYTKNGAIYFGPPGISRIYNVFCAAPCTFVVVHLCPLDRRPLTSRLEGVKMPRCDGLSTACLRRCPGRLLGFREEISRGRAPMLGHSFINTRRVYGFKVIVRHCAIRKVAKSSSWLAAANVINSGSFDEVLLDKARSSLEYNLHATVGAMHIISIIS